MKKTCKLIVVLLICGICGSCTLYESETIESISPPQNGDSIIVHPWNPNGPEIPSVGN